MFAMFGRFFFLFWQLFGQVCHLQIFAAWQFLPRLLLVCFQFWQVAFGDFCCVLPVLEYVASVFFPGVFCAFLVIYLWAKFFLVICSYSLGTVYGTFLGHSTLLC